MSNGIGSGGDNFVNLYNSRALLFQLNPETRTSWLSKGDKPIDVSFVASIRNEQDAGGGVGGPASAKRKLKIVGTNDQGEMVLDAVILPNTSFDKRAPKFGQWIDHTRTLYGLGFDSEPELNEFMATFKQLQQDILTPPLTMPLGGGGGGGAAPTSRHSSAGGPLHHMNHSGGSNTLGRHSNLNSSAINNSLQNNNSLNNIHSSNSNHNISATSETLSKPPASSSNGASIGGAGLLQHENEQLKQALEESSKNAQAWHDELLALRTNNVKLTQALMESKSNVAEWNRELNNLRAENKQLKVRLESVESSLEMDKDEVDEYKEGCIKYKNLAHDFQTKLQDKTSEAEDLRRELKELRLNGNGRTTDDQLDSAGQRRELARINDKLEAKVRELEDIQGQLAQLISTDVDEQS